MRAEMSKFRLAVSNLTAALHTQNKRIDKLESRIEALEMNSGVPQNCEISNLQETVARLHTELEKRNQELLANDLEIAGFPESHNENATHVLLAIAKKLGVPLEDRDVVSAHRVGAVRGHADGGASVARPRPVAVRLARRATRDELLQAARVRRHLIPSDMGLPVPDSPGPPRHFYLNERLSRHNRHIFQKSREAAKHAGWRYVWTREGHIFARQEHGKARYRLGSEADLVRVFGPNAVSGDCL